MILFFDEDVGIGVPTALRAVGLPVQDVITRYKPHKRGKSVADTFWLTDVGRNGWLAISCNKNQLNVQYERETIERESVGIIYLTSGQDRPVDVLHLVLRKWAWLEALHLTIQRPFVYSLSIKGRTAKLPIAPLVRRRVNPRQRPPRSTAKSQPEGEPKQMELQLDDDVSGGVEPPQS